jgi:hypothetical protein
MWGIPSKRLKSRVLVLAWRWPEEIVDLAIRRDSSGAEVLWLGETHPDRVKRYKLL